MCLHSNYHDNSTHKGWKFPRCKNTQALIQETGLTKEVTIRVEGESIIISPIRSARSGWGDVFKKMHENNDDVLIDKNIRSSWDDQEWEWK